MKLNTDCRQYFNDRPCKPHKDFGVVCEGCKYYDKVDFRVLVVKLDALGDVLRTTALLPPLKRLYPRSKVVWLTKKGAADIFKENPYVDEVIFPDAETLFRLQTEEFDLVLNPDTSSFSSQIATIARGKEKRGFVIDQKGVTVSLSDSARSWYETGVNDTLKRQGTKTYQQSMLEVLGLPLEGQKIIWNLSKSEEAFAENFAKKKNLDRKTHRLIGLNTGASGRWKYKKWTLEGYQQLIRRLLNENPMNRVLLYGGGEEGERNFELETIDPKRVINTGSENTLREFGALMNLAHVVVTGDTLALHLAVALRKRTLALFGPTSSNEIDLYSLGEKIIPAENGSPGAAPMKCLCCYLNDCNVRPTCMDNIPVDRVFTSVMRELSEALNRD